MGPLGFGGVDVAEITINRTGFDLKVERLRFGIPQWRVAQKIGCSPGRLSRIECGRESVSPETLAHMAGVIEEMGAARGW